MTQVHRIPSISRLAALVPVAEGLRYFGSAVTGLAFDWAVWVALWQTGLDPASAQGVSRALAGAVVFYLYRRVVFGTAAEPPAGQAVRYLLALAAGWAVSVALVWAFDTALPAPIAKIGADGITFVTNFFVMKRFVFQRR